MSNSEYRVTLIVAALILGAFAQPVGALTMKQCSEKYKAAQDAGVVGSMNWAEFRAAECAAGATMKLKKAKAEKEAAATGPSIEECSARYQAAKDAGALGGMTWNEFRKAGCIAEAAAAAKPVTRKESARVAPADTTKVSEQECSALYEAAKAGGTLRGMTWNEFRKAGCVAEAAAAAKPATRKESARVAPADTTKVSEQECSARYQAAKAGGTLRGMTWNEFRKAGCPTTIAKRSGSMLPTMGTIFPTSIAKKYAGKSAGRARLLTCRDQYEANKAAGITEPKWTRKGGGYYSECNKRLSQQ